MRLTILTILVVFGLSSCMDRVDTRRIRIYNKTSDNIYVYISDTSSIYNEISNINDSLYFNDFKVETNSIYSWPDNPRSWSQFIENSNEEKLYLFVIRQNLVDKNGWKSICKDVLYSKIYRLNIDDLNKCNWEIIVK